MCTELEIFKAYNVFTLKNIKSTTASDVLRYFSTRGSSTHKFKREVHRSF